MGHDWLQQFGFVNIDDCKNMQHIYFIVFYFVFISFQRVQTSEIKINAKTSIYFTFILFHIKCEDGLMTDDKVSTHTTHKTNLRNKGSKNSKCMFLYSFRLCCLWKQEIKVKNFVHQWVVTIVLLQLILKCKHFLFSSHVHGNTEST